MSSPKGAALSPARHVPPPAPCPQLEHLPLQGLQGLGPRGSGRGGPGELCPFQRVREGPEKQGQDPGCWGREETARPKGALQQRLLIKLDARAPGSPSPGAGNELLLYFTPHLLIRIDTLPDKQRKNDSSLWGASLLKSMGRGGRATGRRPPLRSQVPAPLPASQSPSCRHGVASESPQAPLLHMPLRFQAQVAFQGEEISVKDALVPKSESGGESSGAGCCSRCLAWRCRRGAWGGSPPVCLSACLSLL